MNFTILGLDTASEYTGWAVLRKRSGSPHIRAHGTLYIKPDRGKKLRPMGERLDDFQKGLEALFRKFRPTHAAIEQHHIRFAKAAVTLFRFIGVAELTAYRRTKKPVIMLTPSKIRSEIRAKDKAHVRRVVNDHFGLEIPEEFDDEADAVAVAWAALAQARKMERK